MASLRLISTQTDPCPQSAVKPAEPRCVEIFQQEFEYLIRTLRRLGASPNDVEDLAQEVFLVLHQSWEKYDQSRPIRAYLAGIAFRVLGNHARKRKREVLYAVMESSSTGPRPDQALESSQVRALVLAALKRVPMQRRAVLVMHDIDKLPMADIAVALSIYRFTGYSRLRKARVEFAAAMSFLLGASEL